MKNILKAFYVVIVVLLITILTIFYSFFVAKKEYKNVNLNIKKGTTFTQIYKDLKLNFGILDRIYLKTLGEDFKLKIGTYKFNGKLSKYEILKKIKNKESNGIRVTIPEGFTKKHPHENNNFEGYFYPETYIFNEGVTTKQVLNTILNEFLKKFPPQKYPDKQKFYNQLKLASIVEAEVSDSVDRPKVAGIFIKRLEIGMKLESDATLKYELGRQALRGELKTMETPYNSYKVKGLPPTPIGNPPVETFRAVEKAEVTDNLFFFTHKGKTYYSKTHEEHLKKRRESGQLK